MHPTKQCPIIHAVCLYGWRLMILGYNVITAFLNSNRFCCDECFLLRMKIDFLKRIGFFCFHSQWMQNGKKQQQQKKHHTSLLMWGRAGFKQKQKKEQEQETDDNLLLNRLAYSVSVNECRLERTILMEKHGKDILY